MTKQFSFGRAFTAACMGMLLFGVVIITLGSMLPSLITKFQLNEIKAGTLTALLPFGILTGSLLFGPIVDRHSYKYLLITCVLLIMIGIEGIAFTESIQVLHLSIFLIGLGGDVFGLRTAYYISICLSLIAIPFIYLLPNKEE